MKTLLTMIVHVAILLQTIGFAADEKADGPIQITVKLDRTEYMHGQPGAIYAVTPTGRLTATLTIKNVSPAKQKLTFSSGQKYDFVIRDATKEEIKRWSKDRMFTQALENLTLAPAQEQTYKEIIDLGESGNPLPLGDYTLEGLLTCSTPLTSTSVPFKIIATPLK